MQEEIDCSDVVHYAKNVMWYWVLDLVTRPDLFSGTGNLVETGRTTSLFNLSQFTGKGKSWIFFQTGFG